MSAAPSAPSLVHLPVPTPLGSFVAGYSAVGLARLRFPGETAPTMSPLPAGPMAAWHALTRSAVEAVLAGRMPETLPPLDLSAGTAFQRSVWQELLEIGPGQRRTYGEIAARLGRPGAARAVGAACGANPVPVLVPCHRVLAAGGKLGGFSGGLEWKRRLLGTEQAEWAGLH